MKPVTQKEKDQDQDFLEYMRISFLVIVRLLQLKK